MLGETLNNNNAPEAKNEWEEAMKETRVEDVDKAWEMALASKDDMDSAVLERDKMKEGLEMSDHERAKKFGVEFGDIDTFADKYGSFIDSKIDAAERAAEKTGHAYDVRKNALEKANNRINGMPEKRVNDDSEQGLDDFLDELERS